jgi:putative spermidine/putrescine transport system ATP-binding protein
MPSGFLELDRVAGRYGGHVAVEDLSLSLGPAQRLVLLGPPAAGKSVVLALLAGFLRPSAGSIWLAGNDITRVAARARRIGLVSGKDTLFPHMTLLDNVAFGLKMRGLDRTERRRLAGEALGRLGLESFATRYPRHLAPAQRRLTALARAIVVQPDLLLWDEKEPQPDTVRSALRTALAEMSMAAVLVVQDREAGLALADRVALLEAGQLRQFGPPQELYECPASRFAAEFFGRCNLLAGRLTMPGGSIGEVALASGVAWARMPAALPPGPIVLAVRPHRVRLDPDGPVRGPVEHVDYLGAITRVTLRLPQGPFVAELAVAPAGLARGAELGFGWAAEDAWLLADEP